LKVIDRIVVVVLRNVQSELIPLSLEVRWQLVVNIVKHHFRRWLLALLGSRKCFQYLLNITTATTTT